MHFASGENQLSDEGHLTDQVGRFAPGVQPAPTVIRVLKSFVQQPQRRRCAKFTMSVDPVICGSAQA
jgi:hypothetical protein